MTALTTRDTLITIGIALVIVGSVFGAALQSNLWSAPRTSTIYADTTPPVIKEAASTHGSIMITDQDPTLLCFVEENLDMHSVTAEILGRDWLGRYVNTLEEIELNYVSKNGDIYKYRSTVTENLEANTQYKVRYTAQDKAGNKDTATLDLKVIELDGTVWVNDIKVTTTDQTIYLQTHTLAITAKVNIDTDDIQKVQLLLNGDMVDVLEYRWSSKDYFTSYQLPADGEYDLLVQVLAVGGAEIRLASFHIGLNSGLNPWLLAGATLTLLALAGTMIYLQRREAYHGKR